MSSLIANKVKINMCLVSIKYNNNYNNNCCWLFSLHFSSPKRCLHHTQRVFTQDWLNSYYSFSALSCLLIALRNCLKNVLEVECSIVTLFLFVYSVDIVSCCVSLRCVLVIYLFYTHTDIVVGLLITRSVYVLG